MRDYSYYKQAIDGLSLPTAIVDMNALDANIDSIVHAAGNMPIRVASKSIRCTHLLRHIVKHSPTFVGVMSFTMREAVFLAHQGFDNIIVGYPSTDRSDIKLAIETNQQLASHDRVGILPMVDCREHLKLIHEEAQQLGCVQPICVDIDMSSHFPPVHFGVYRSPINSEERFERFLDLLAEFPSVRLEAVMGYEAQIAGVGDRNPTTKLLNPIIRRLKKRSIRRLAKRRQAVVQLAKDAGQAIKIVNGGGTGSVDSTIKDSSVTEVTVGSGFYSPALFDHYDSFHYQPAACFALEIVRQPLPGMWTLLGGGYVASGSVGKDKQPVPFLPEGVKLVTNEGTGEVQTPIIYGGQESLHLSAPVFFRHAKAGELCERFAELHLIRNGRVEEVVPTYRGEGLCFL